jgi:hypothetical protein
MVSNETTIQAHNNTTMFISIQHAQHAHARLHRAMKQIPTMKVSGPIALPRRILRRGVLKSPFKFGAARVCIVLCCVCFVLLLLLLLLLFTIVLIEGNLGNAKTQAIGDLRNGQCNALQIPQVPSRDSGALCGNQSD